MSEVIIEQKEKISGKVAIPEVINGAGIKSIEQTSTSSEDGGVNTITVTLTDGETSTFEVRNGSKGSQGNPGEKGEKGESGAQSDWDQNDKTAPDYVKNRPFYTGDPVETVLVEESTVAFSDHRGIYTAEFPSTFEATVGETYKVSWDGTIYECTCVSVEVISVIGNLSIVDAGSDTGEPFVMGINNKIGILIYTADTSASHTFSISGIVPEVVKIDEKYFPENIATKSEVEVVQAAAHNAQTTANNAQTTANNAQTAVDNAQTTINNMYNMANSNKEVLYSAFGSAVTFMFDKQTSGRDTFKFNAFNYYKISDFNPAPEDVISFKGTRESGDELSKIMIGNNCVEYGFFIVVASAGACSIPITETATGKFTAPSAGLYAKYTVNNSRHTAGTGEFTLRGSTGSLSITGLLLKSSTGDSTKKFRITVDDSGAPTVTNESDSTNIWKPINLPTVTASDAGKFLRVSDTGEWVKEEVNIPSTVTDDHINSLIDSKLGVIENGTY